MTKPDGSTADSSYSGLIMYVQNLNQQIGEYEETHKNDCQPVNEMIQTIQSIIASRTKEHYITNRVEKAISIKEICCFSIMEYLFVYSIDKYDTLFF